MQTSEIKSRCGSLPRTRGAEGRRLAPWVVFVLWAAAISVPLGVFSAAHMAALPVAAGPVAGESTREVGEWSLVHVVAESCPCSQSVLDYLLGREALADGVEEVVVIDGNAAALRALRERGFAARRVEAESFRKQFGSEGVPFFQAISPEGAVAYSGAYFSGMGRSLSGFLDLETFSQAQAGRAPANRAVFGCATSERLKTLLDPFSLKYATKL